MKRIHLILVLVYTFCHSAVYAQDWKRLGSDELFALAREEAFDGKREAAREKLFFILEKSPDYADVRILLGRTYAWDGKRKEAKQEFQKVLEKEPEYKDALNALIDVLMWDENYAEALIVADRSLKIHPNFDDFLYKKAVIQKNLEAYADAIHTTNHLLELNPASQRAKDLLESIKVAKQLYAINYRIGGDYFDRSSNQYTFYSSLQLSRRNSWGTSIARVNFARRFETNGLQGEIDLYPTIANGLYAYLNYGYSKSALFPEHRIGAELFKSLPKSFETSLGLRHLIFSSDSKVTIYTGSVGWYYKSMWFSLRPFITPDKRAGTSFSLVGNVRKYFESADTYIGLLGGFGFSPDIRTIQSASGFANDQLFTLRSQRGGITFQKLIRYNLVASADFDVVHQELSYDLGNYMWIYSLVGNLTYRF
ncbi:YaiO family outer membrane beta-barrel protein [Marinoscillum sp.]|uniref:YaiO family outer membrane beta-barrel protein n=1 Tax=Marinoscillum sp. TaxID=2024838 RepID=UPI003BAD9B43